MPTPRVLLALVATAALGRAAFAQEATPAARRWTAGVSAGAAVPTGDLRDIAHTGVAAAGYVAFTPARFPLGVRAELGYTRFGLTDEAVGIPGASGSVQYLAFPFVSAVYTVPGAGRVAPYVLGGLGPVSQRIRLTGTSDGVPREGETNSTDMGWAAGAGTRFPVGGLRGFVEVRYTSVATTSPATHFLPVSVGLTF